MRDVVIIGGGLTGLAAAHELQKNGIPYTLIEVKAQCGGSLRSVQRAGFIFDSGPMFQPVDDMDFLTGYLHSLGLTDAIVTAGINQIAFKQGTQALIDALTHSLRASVMNRMAVSTLGFMDKNFAICMENGMLLDAKALIVTAPARHAERMFYTMVPEISYRLLDYRYDTITRLSLGFQNAPPISTTPPEDYPIPEIQCIQQPERGGTVVQVALRMSEVDLPADPVGETAALMGWPLNPDSDHIATWVDSDPIMWRDPQHSETMTTIQRLLPDGVTLAGSDYVLSSNPPRLDERIRQGITAAQRISLWLK